MQKKRKFGSAPQKSAFKPRTKDDNFLLSVIMATGKMLFMTILILCVAGGGLLVPGMLQGRMTTDAQRDEKIRSFIRNRFSFDPSEDYVPHTLEDRQYIPWEELLDEIPRLVEAQLKIIEV